DSNPALEKTARSTVPGRVPHDIVAIVAGQHPAQQIAVYRQPALIDYLVATQRDKDVELVLVQMAPGIFGIDMQDAPAAVFVVENACRGDFDVAPFVVLLS